jgi:hypothetical protein
LLTPTKIAKEALFQLENNCVLGANVHRQYKKEFVKIGDSVTIRRPVKFLASDGATRVTQDVTELSTSITINKRKHVSWKFSTQDLTLTIEEYSERYIKPAMIALANKVDEDGCEVAAKNFYSSSGTPGTTPNAFSFLSSAAQKLDDGAVPDDGMRRIFFNPAARWAMANGMGGTGSGGVFNADIVHGMVRRGMLGQIANFDIYGDQNVYRLQTGVRGGTPLTNGVPANNASTLVIDGATASVTNWARAGDVFTIAGVNAVNPISKQDTGVLQQFVVLAAANSDGTGNVTLSIAPNLINASGTNIGAAYQTVSALPADNAALTFIGTANTTYPQNLAFHENALALVTVPLELPDSAAFKARADWRGYSIRVVKDYDIDADEEIIRLDIMYGWKAIYPDLGHRIWG